MGGPQHAQLIARVSAYIVGMTESRMRLARKNIESKPKGGRKR